MYDQVSDKRSGLRVEARVDAACIQAGMAPACADAHLDKARGDLGVREDAREDGREKHSVASEVLD